MASLSEIFIKKEVLQQLANTTEAGVKITISLSDEPNKWGQNVSAFVSQSKEEREGKESKTYVGNGKTFWSKGETPVNKKDADPF